MRVKSQAILHAGGAVAYAAAQWLVLALATRFGSLSTVGLYVYCLALLTPASVFLSFGVRNLVATDSKENLHDQGYRAIQGAGLAAFALYFLVILVLVREDVLIAAIVFASKAADMSSEGAYGEWIRHGKGSLYGVSKLLRLLVFIGLAVVAFWMGARDKYLLLSYPIALILVLALHDIPRTGMFPRLGTFSRSLFILAIPLAVSSFIISLTANVPRLVVKWTLDLEAVAAYAVLIYLISLAAIPVSSVCQLLLPNLALGRIFDKRSVARRLVLVVAVYGLAFLVMLPVLGNFAVAILYGTQIGYSTLSLSAVGVGGAVQFLIAVGNAILVARRRFRAVLLNALVGLISMCLATYPAAHYFGLEGAYFGFAAAMAVTAVFLIFILKKEDARGRVLESC